MSDKCANAPIAAAFIQNADGTYSPWPVDAGGNPLVAIASAGVVTFTGAVVTPGNPVATTNGMTNYSLISAADTNLTSLKGTAGRVMLLTATNTSAALKYLKLYNKATAPDLTSDTPIYRLGIPAGATISLPLSFTGLFFSLGIAFAITGSLADDDTTNLALGDVLLNISYL